MYRALPRTPFVVTVVITAVVSVLATLGVVTALDDSSESLNDRRPLPSSRAQLEEQALALLPEAADGAWTHTELLLGQIEEIDATFAIPPGEYQMHFGCQMLSHRNPWIHEVQLFVRSTAGDTGHVLPCPSESLPLSRPLMYTEPVAMALATWDVSENPDKSYALAVMVTGTPATGAVE